MALVRPAHAEALDDSFIRALYAQAATTVGDPPKARAFMDERLDEHYTLQSNYTQYIGNAAPQKATLTSVKADVIENAARGYGIMRADRYRNRITAIKYARDGGSAYVTDTTVSSGTISIALPGGGFRAAKYQDAESCVKQVGLVGGILKFLQGVCNENFAVKD